ncbi:hypothetical protein HBI80_087060 [Parastagonospora nodorum]|nr:hypothetical protein HBI80_087060 [Parastagonospora nodorum]
MMGELQQQQSSDMIDRGRRAHSFPIYEPPNKPADKMGRSYRTPSPRREPYFAEGEEITPKLKLNLRRPVVMDTPPGSPSDGFNAPATPTKQTVSMTTFGLLTPCTPNFGNFFRPAPASPTTPGLTDDSDVGQQHGASGSDVGAGAEDGYDSDKPLATQFDKMQQQIRDAEFAASLSEEARHGRSRRSTRLALKDVVKVAPVNTIKVAAITQSMKLANPVVPARNVSSPESSLTADAVVQLPPDINPAVLTLDWQLQYPPGGSTHPSYPYPQMDPRLFFDPVHVPIVDGLPNVFRVAPLLLPIGWRHVSWSGFLPIVFDPYQQAFKLTPIGPLPLPCEEVHQGGLAKYVPGGKEHPEAGLLPDIAPLSDGSDEIYNFEGVDWTLPWPKGENFDGSASTGAVQLANGLLSPITGDSPSYTNINKPYSHYIEAQDCPDGIVDIADAWRWLTERELDPTATFVPSPDKSWKNTGIYRTTRVGKEPIASLMALALSDVAVSPNNPIASYLKNQNGRVFCPFRSMATPVHVKITLLGEVEITLVELLSYFPNHYLWRKCSDRLVGAGLTGMDITNFINYTRELEGDATRSNNTINAQLTYETEVVSGKRVKIVREPHIAAYTTEGWAYTAWELTDYPLLGLAHGLKHMPEGPDAGPLTAAMKWARENGRYKALLSEVPELLQQAGLQLLIEPGESGDPDKEVKPMHVEKLKKDRIRVLEDARMRKRAAEKAEDGKRKRVKTE